MYFVSSPARMRRLLCAYFGLAHRSSLQLSGTECNIPFFNAEFESTTHESVVNKFPGCQNIGCWLRSSQYDSVLFNGINFYSTSTNSETSKWINYMRYLNPTSWTLPPRALSILEHRLNNGVIYNRIKCSLYLCTQKTFINFDSRFQSSPSVSPRMPSFPHPKGVLFLVYKTPDFIPLLPTSL